MSSFISQNRRCDVNIGMNSGIYKIYFINNQKVYIGSSVNLAKRKYEHLRTLRKSIHTNRYLQRAFNKMGEKHFVFEIIERCNRDSLLIKEQYWINFFNSSKAKFGFNLVPNVVGTGTSGYKLSSKQKKKRLEILEEKVWNKKKKNFKFINPDEQVVEIFGLRQFCLKNNLHYRTMCNIHAGVGISCMGWKKYFPDGSVRKRKGSEFVLIKDKKKIKVNNLRLFCKENGLKYDVIRKGYCSEGFVLED